MKIIITAFCFLLFVSSFNFAQSPIPNPNPLSVEKLRGNVYIIRQNIVESINAGYVPTKVTNNVVLIDPRGSLLVDTDDPASSIEKYKEALANIPGIKNGKINKLINTHWHYDHTGLNYIFGKEGTEIIAHWNVSEILIDPPVVRDVNGILDPLPVEGQPVEFVAINPVFLHYKKEVVELIPFLGGHSNTDMAVLFRKANVISLGDLQFGHWFPFIDRTSGGNIKSMIRILKDIDDTYINDNTIIVPGHGIVINRVQYREYIADLEEMQKKIQSFIDQGLTEEETVSMKPFSYLDPTWGWFFVNGDFFTRLLYRDIHKDPR